MTFTEIVGLVMLVGIMSKNGILIVEFANQRKEQGLKKMEAVIDAAGLPAHTVQFGAKGCVTWQRDRVRNYRDYRSGHIEVAFAQWIHGINRGILLPPGLDEQWLVSVMHDETTAMRYADVFGEFAAELTA